MCHGLDGAAGDRAPALGAQRRYLRRTGPELFDAIKNGIKGTLMPASPMPDADVWKIVAYIRSLRAVAADVEIAGNARNGEAVFHGKGSCSQCHSLRGRGGILGPDLSNIGAERRIDDLKAALTQAKPVPPRGYQPVTLRTKEGLRIEGLVRNENNFSLQVLGKDERLHLLSRDELASIEYAPASIMPADYDKRLTPDELQDVLAFLSRQTAERGSR
jgi:putative heme-binding domain-containing protein